MIHLYNTLTKKKEKLQTLVANKVGLYVCGVTVYDYCHLGHARTYMFADLLVRYLTFRGYEVNYVRNITDIDDKIIKRAKEAKQSVEMLTQQFILAMHEDFAALDFKSPTHEPKATAYISNMIALIQKILMRGHAYAVENGDVYFDVRSFKPYGCLSHHAIDDLESGARVEIGELKRDPLDFALWKAAKPEEPAWDSPWGKGRPGWHIECSAMAMELLGEQFDIHAGGRDLIFPHHENEIAQSQSASQQPFAHLWMHGGYLQVEKEKMSKSLGNFITIRDVLKKHEAETVRYVLVGSHYRSPLLYAEDALFQAKQSLTRLYTSLRFLPDAEPIENAQYEKQFIDAMDDDLNTPIALSVLFNLAHDIHGLKKENELKAAEHAALLKKLAAVLGLLQQDPEHYLQSGEDIDKALIEGLIQKRQQARTERNWAEADRIRSELLTMNIIIEDNAQGTHWRKG